MNKLRILGIETHFKTNGDKEVTSGVDWARIVLPLRELSKNPDFEVKIVKNPFKDNKETWDSLTKYYDIIYSSYIDSPEGYVNMAVHAKKNNCKVIVDLDDDLWEIPEASPVYQTYHIGSFALDVVSKVIEDVSYVTTTNSHLKYDICHYTGKHPSQVHVLPNYLDLDMYDKNNIKEVKRDNIVIGFFGSNTHVVDVMMPEYLNAIARICKEFPNVEYKTIGLFLPQIKTKLGKQYSFLLGHADVNSWASVLWPQMMSEVDIFTAPLLNTNFSKCKSHIKMMEIGAGAKPAVFSDIRQYKEVIQHDKDGYLASTEGEWYRYLKELVVSEQKRRDMGQALYEKVYNEWQMKLGVKRYAEYFKDVHSGKKTSFLIDIQ
jgi:glycosyltransferase involved in cell wall biosynthesis